MRRYKPGRKLDCEVAKALGHVPFHPTVPGLADIDFVYNLNRGEGLPQVPEYSTDSQTALQLLDDLPEGINFDVGRHYDKTSKGKLYVSYICMITEYKDQESVKNMVYERGETREHAICLAVIRHLKKEID